MPTNEVAVTTPTVYLHQSDLPDDINFGSCVAIDTEAMGLLPHRDRLCLVQLSSGDGTVHLVQMNRSKTYNAPNLVRLLNDRNILKLFHFARFDVAILNHALGANTGPIYCTKIASKLVRTYTERHGLKELLRELLAIDISKEAQSSDWGSPELSLEQQRYAATDVLYLHRLKEVLDQRLIREGRMELAQQCFDFMPAMTTLDLLGDIELNVLKH
ncbi:MAG: ribonuclease D [Holosporales bacterium]